ncbi:hypothetical protein C2S53_000604 [Perilla frutescens var. hirtella]|uniref:Uncharacterized protein n=1 Tax=Perilla frutescens var. hirtella TaxID=608512 RepID=A0AAD4IYX8_PERFH|nr:hypothetical protein C2S53_000604 [Perilla frutescens var. hirtella]
MLLNQLKQGRGPVVASTVGGTLFVIMISLLYNITTIQTRTVEAGTVNPTDQVLLANQLLEASLLEQLNGPLDVGIDVIRRGGLKLGGEGENLRLIVQEDNNAVESDEYFASGLNFISIRIY